MQGPKWDRDTRLVKASVRHNKREDKGQKFFVFARVLLIFVPFVVVAILVAPGGFWRLA